MPIRAFAALLFVVVACTSPAPRFIDAGLADARLPVDAMASPDVDAGEVDAAPATGRPGQATVSGAVKARSPGYTLYGTLRSGDGSSASPSYQRRGGVTGATQP